MKILVLGATGYIGSNLMDMLAKSDMEFEGWSSKDMDFLNRPKFGRWLEEFSTVINCIGAPDLDRAVNDKTYRERMWALNVAVPLMIREHFRGHMIHISSPFAIIEHEKSDYAESKRISDSMLRKSVCNTTIVFPGWLFGGRNSKQIDFVLKNGEGKSRLIDNKKLGNPTHIHYLCRALCWLAKRRIFGNVLVYDQLPITAEGIAKDIMCIWSDSWTTGFYEDRAIRPMDWSFENISYINRCIETKEGFDVRPNIQ